MDWQEKTDEDLAFLIQSGNAQLFSILVKRYENKFGRYARKFLSDKEDINDVLQEIFIKIYINIKNFDTKRKFSSWAYRVAHNELVNTLKKRQKKILPIINLDIFLPHSLAKDEFNKNNDRQDFKKIADDYLDKIETKYREPVILYYLEDLSYKEIADVMQIPISTVGIRIKRAKEMLKKIHANLKHKYE